MATYTIKAVRVGSVPYPSHHEHIEAVKLTDESVLTRGQVIAMIGQGHVFLTVGGGQVYVHRCPHCGTGDYITTHPDSTVTNNLLHLPRF